MTQLTALQEQLGYRFQNEALLLFSHGVALFGTVEIGAESSNLQIKVIHDDDKTLTLADAMLEPIPVLYGKVNVNTADENVLRSVLGSDVLVQQVLENRPLGIKEKLKLGVGELFLLNEDFIPVSSLLTVRSDTYEINCTGEYNPEGKTLAYQNIRTVMERGD